MAFHVRLYYSSEDILCGWIVKTFNFLVIYVARAQPYFQEMDSTLNRQGKKTESGYITKLSSVESHAMAQMVQHRRDGVIVSDEVSTKNKITSEAHLSRSSAILTGTFCVKTLNESYPTNNLISFTLITSILHDDTFSIIYSVVTESG